MDAVRMKQALNAAALDESAIADEPVRMLTTQELVHLKQVVDSLTLAPRDCNHLRWDWPMGCCPSCGATDWQQGKAEANP